MPRIDRLTHTLMQKPKCFADAFNMLLYDGKEVIRPENLMPCDPRHVFYPDAKEDRRIPIFHRVRDVFKQCVIFRDGRAHYVFLGIENQTLVDDLMSARGMLYEALALNAQVQIHKDEAKQRHLLKTPEEIVSGVPRGTKLLPVITLIPFFSNKPWDGPRCTHDLLNTDDPTILRYIPNYYLNLLIPAEMTVERIGMLRSELRVLFRFLHCSASGGDVEELLQSEVGSQEISWHTTALIKDLLHVTQIRLPKNQEETTTMCQAMERYEKKIHDRAYNLGKNDGYDLGKNDGYDLGKNDGVAKVICNMLKEKADIAFICRVAGVSEEQVHELENKGGGKKAK